MPRFGHGLFDLLIMNFQGQTFFTWYLSLFKIHDDTSQFNK